MAGDGLGVPRSFDSPTRYATMTLNTTNKNLGLRKDDQKLGRDMKAKYLRDENQKEYEHRKLQVIATREENMRLYITNWMSL